MNNTRRRFLKTSLLGGAAIAAGCDLVLHCNGDFHEMERAREAAGELRPEAASRADIAVQARRTPTDIDITALAAEFTDLMQFALD